MTESIEELGPVDYLVVEFPGSNFNGEILPELADLVRRGIVRVLDLLLITKDDTGGYEAFEFGDTVPGDLGELRDMESELADLLSEDDVTAVAETLERGSTAALLVYENLWAAPFASAVRRGRATRGQRADPGAGDPRRVGRDRRRRDRAGEAPRCATDAGSPGRASCQLDGPG